MKILTAIAKEHEVKWDSKAFEEELQKPKEDLLVCIAEADFNLFHSLKDSLVKLMSFTLLLCRTDLVVLSVSIRCQWSHQMSTFLQVLANLNLPQIFIKLSYLANQLVTTPLLSLT